MTCKNCKTKPVWKFTNQTELCKKCFCFYVESKVFRTIRKYGMLSGMQVKLKKEKFQIIALEQSENSIDYKKVKTKNKTAIILGEEVHGLNKKVLDLTDIIMEIPMRGVKESLNVSVSFGVAAFRIFNI